MTRKNNKKRVTFRIDAPEVNQVILAGTFNNWDQNARPLKQDKSGTWKTQLSLEPGTYEYLLIVDGAWQEDSACPERCPNPFGTHNNIVSI